MDEQYGIDSTEEKVFLAYNERKQLFQQDEESKQYSWNQRYPTHSVSPSHPLNTDLPSKLSMASNMKTWTRELEKARSQLKRNTANQAIYSKQITMKIDQCRDLEARLVSLDPSLTSGRTEAEEALRNAQVRFQCQSRCRFGLTVSRLADKGGGILSVWVYMY